jgi:hypothetical protein
MTISLFSQQKNILMLSDDVLSIFVAQPEGMGLAKTVEWSDPDFDSIVTKTINVDGKGRPVTILNDMLEQHYRKEKITRAGVGMMDRNSMVRRKLMAAFPSYPMRASLPLKDKGAKTKTGAAADTYLFAAIPDSGAFQQTVDVAQKGGLKFTGTYLLPVEASDMVQQLAGKLLKKKPPAKSWTIFVGRHRHGGLRQIVIRNGDLALTRMTPMHDMNGDSAHWAREVSQEFKATMSYVSRFGYEPTDGLNVVVVCDDECGVELEQTIGAESDFFAVGVSEAAKLLGLKVDDIDNENYADILHVSWVASRSRAKLPMRISEIDRVARPRAAVAVLTLLFLCSGSYLAYQAFGEFSELSSVKSDVSKTAIRKARLAQEYDVEVERMKEFGVDFALVQNSLRVKKMLDKQHVDSLSLFSAIATALEGNMTIDSISLEPKKDDKLEKFLLSVKDVDLPLIDLPDDFQYDALYKALLKISYPTTANVDAANREIKAFSERLEKELPNHRVKVEKYVKDYAYTENVVIDSSGGNDDKLALDFMAQILIEGSNPVAEISEEDQE